ncbi:MAG: hypothetical protein Q4F84_01805 [Fibrobacter sp.]|nr:hypothetical protein [Fibrobacter sp.]
MTVIFRQIVLFTVLLLATCSRMDEKFDAKFLPDGSIRVMVFDGVHEVKIFDQQKNLLGQSPVFENNEVELMFPWEADSEYIVYFDGREAGTVQAPLFHQQYRLRIHAPVGQKACDIYFSEEKKSHSDTIIYVPVHEMEKIDLLFEVEKLCDTAKGEVSFQAESLVSDLSVLLLNPQSIQDTGLLEFEFDKKLWTMQASIIDTPITGNEAFRARVTADNWQQSFVIAFVMQSDDTGLVSITDWALPTDQNGYKAGFYSAGSILMPNPLWNRIGSWFGVEPEILTYNKPFTFQTINIANNGNDPVGFMLTGEMLDVSTGTESHWFKAPNNQFTGGTDKIVSFVNVDSGQTETCVLPIYIESNTPAGLFKSRITVQRMGSDHVLRCIENTVSVVRSNVLFTSWTLGAAILSLGWLIVVILFYKRIVNSIGLRIFVLFSLLGSLQFCISFVGRIVSSAMSALLGPFNCLVGGLVTEVLTYLLITAILFLVPRVGAMTLAGIVSYIMGGILFGSFGLTDILFTGSGIAFKEILLLGFGVTKFRQSSRQPSIVPMMLALGIADAASTFTSLTLHTVFYRLYFADWYILLSVIVTGFLYTVIGVFLGKSLGQSLRKVHL